MKYLQKLIVYQGEFFKHNKKYKKQILIGIVALSLMTVLFLFSQSNGYIIKVDGKEVGLVKDNTTYLQVIEELRQSKEAEDNLVIKNFSNEIQIVEATEKEGKPLSRESLKDILGNHIQWICETTSIEINDQPKVYVKSPEEGEKILSQLKDKYLPKEEGLEVLSVDFEEKVTLGIAEVNLYKVLDYQDALEFILNGTDKFETYKVKLNDTLWDVALANNLSVRELKEANPNLKSDTLSIGQELKLVKSEPLINVVAVAQVTKEETIGFDTKYVNNAQLFSGQTKVEQSGQAGKKEVTYKILSKNDIEIEKQVLSEKIVEKPTTKVVQRGTQVMTASRGGGGSGQLAWPLRGSVTSGYGSRGSGFHSGIDITGKTGNPIFAADKGNVIFAGWYGNYGYCIDIDHGDGLLTRYAHLSKMEVSVGQSVTRGQQIGRVGSTGRSTGPHLHFEVRVNGSHKNPTRYLN